MNAREMFKSLGYKYRKNDLVIEYLCFDKCIAFWLNEHEFFAKDGVCDIKCINVNEFKAIQQQMKELGWI